MVKTVRKTIKEKGVGIARHDTYKDVLEQYSKAMENGFYLEAITLMESIIGDRLESIANQISKSSEYSYETLGKLITAVKKFEISTEMPNIIEKIDVWRKDRNIALHEMAKFDKVDFEKSFNKRYAELKPIAQNGKKIFRELDKEIRNYRKLKTNQQ